MKKILRFISRSFIFITFQSNFVQTQTPGISLYFDPTPEEKLNSCVGIWLIPGRLT